MSFNPGRIINDRINTLRSFAGEATSLINDFESRLPALNVSPQTRTSTVRVMNRADIGINDVTGAFQESLGNLSRVVPPALGNFAQGIGTTLGRVDNVFGQFNSLLGGASNLLNSVSSLATGGFGGLLNNVASSFGNRIENFFGDFIGDFSKLELGPGQLLTSVGVSGSQIGSLTRPENRPSPKFAKVKNQIRDFASYNCISTFGVLSSRSLENPNETYRKRGADYTILRSGGGGIENSNRIVTAYDQTGGNLEYFIDDITIEAIVHPNQSTSVSTATTIEFKVYEPYSLGLFLQSLQEGAAATDYSNYLEAVYLLELDFIGWDEENNPIKIEYSGRKIPIKLTKIDFNVEQGGSVYNVRAIAYNEIALSDEIQRIQDSVSITGPTVADCLTFGERSLTSYLNTKMQTIAEAENLSSSDLYTIVFPSTVANGAPPTDTGGRLTELEEQRTIFGAQLVNPETSEVSQYVQAARQRGGATFNALRSSSITDVNRIGAAEMLENFAVGGDHPFAFPSNVYNQETGICVRSEEQLNLSDTNREYRFAQGMSIQKIIEEIVLISGYGRNIAQAREDENSMIPWFRIETEIYHIDDPQFESVKGRKARIYVYKVIPFDVSISNFVSPSSGAGNLPNLAGHAVKEYNYIYTGQNEDVLGFDIQFNAAFYEAVRADRNNLGADDNLQGRNNIVAADADPDLSLTGEVYDDAILRQARNNGTIAPGFENVTRGRVENSTDNGPATGGGGETSRQTNYARQIHNTLLNSQVDLISADLEIWGDPYFLPDSGLGNYSAERGPTIAMNSDGTMDYQRNEVDIIVNFRTPIDYDDQGGMRFPGDELGTRAVKGFSGLYKVLQVTSTISGNQFKQNLRILRRRNQEIEGVSDSRVLTESPNSVFNPNDRRNSRSQTGSGNVVTEGPRSPETSVIIPRMTTGTPLSIPPGGTAEDLLPPPVGTDSGVTTSPITGAIQGITANPDGSINRGTTGPNFQISRVRPATPQRSFGTFNANGTVSGAGQAARPGSRPAPSPRSNLLEQNNLAGDFGNFGSGFT